MCHMEIKHRHAIPTPWNQTFALKLPTGISHPHLFAERTGDGGFRWRLGAGGSGNRHLEEGDVLYIVRDRFSILIL